MKHTAMKLFSTVFAGILGFSTVAGTAQAGGGCGCEAPTVVCAPRCHHHRHCHYPPTGILVQSAPVMATQMMAAPMMAQPAMFAAPAAQVTFAAPAQYALVQVAPSSTSSNTNSNLNSNCQGATELLEELRKLRGGQASSLSQAALGSQAEQDLARLQDRVGEIETTIKQIKDLITDQNKAILELRNK
ncbi:hypothetical protein ETAA8_32700 [Anatilimnocola aggregata]|uniref:Uncharacterized protein n=1 Tax=Anatilimnocola aggregata TaxID=2528021 RepID=A0A517YD57_9BACT|nr:hypothetical protein [Anatilimnocola aggregata]QDU28170.1 hypothetical protein ETAA8_32700 [Anatilimnocola aggregata]